MVRCLICPAIVVVDRDRTVDLTLLVDAVDAFPIRIFVGTPFIWPRAVDFAVYSLRPKKNIVLALREVKRFKL